MFYRRRPKVFCIGFNKTGTTSLHRYFCESGLSSLHGVGWSHWSFDRALRRKFWWWTCYSDGEEANFRNLEAWFPDSLFLLNLRDARPWIRSRIKHVMRLGYQREFERGIFPAQFGEMAVYFFTDPEDALDKWLLERSIYHRAVRRHFRARKNFMELDVTADEIWECKLDDFLGRYGLLRPNARDGPRIHANARSKEEVTDSEKLQQFFALAEARIAAFSETRDLD